MQKSLENCGNEKIEGYIINENHEIRMKPDGRIRKLQIQKIKNSSQFN